MLAQRRKNVSEKCSKNLIGSAQLNPISRSCSVLGNNSYMRTHISFFKDVASACLCQKIHYDLLQNKKILDASFRITLQFKFTIKLYMLPTLQLTI